MFIWKEQRKTVMIDPYAAENLFGIEGLNIAWYGVFIAAAFFLGAWIADREAKRQGLGKDCAFDFLLIALPIVIICARAYYVIFEWDSYKNNMSEIYKVWHGGLAIYGGVIGGVIVAAFFCRKRKIPFLKFADILIPSLALGQSIGRWGNFVNQEAFGNIITNERLQFFPYAVYIERLEEWHQATFFYESICTLTIFIVLMCLRHRKKYDGQLFSVYLIAYGIVRFFVEGLRTDSLYIVPGIRVSQLVSIGIVVIGVFVSALCRKKGRRSAM